MTGLLITALTLMAITLTVAAHSDTAPGFLKKGDVWVCTGDSITNADTYRRTLDRVIRHFHPESGVRVINIGISGALIGATASEFEKAAKTDRPTVVSIMSAMNHSTHAPCRVGEQAEPYIADYISSLRKMVRSTKERGMTVIVMSPTLTDERNHADLAGTRAFLTRCTEEIIKLSEQEGVLYLPVSEEMEAAQEKLPATQVYRRDGIHPSSLGEYQIASTFFKHLNLWDEPSGQRQVSTNPEPSLPIDITLASKTLAPDERKLTLRVTSPRPTTVTATWSCRNMRGQETLKLNGSDTWAISLPKEIATLENGESDDVIIDLTDGVSRSIYVVDLCRTRVMHFEHNKIAGVITSPTNRPEGKTEAKWQISRQGNGLLFEAQVTDSEIRSDYIWPWGRDGITFWLDFRPTERFGDIGVDSEVHQTCITVTDNPEFKVDLIPWLGQGMAKAASVTGEKTPTGYNIRMLLNGKFDENTDSSLSGRDFIGVNIGHVDLDGVPNSQPTPNFAWMQQTKLASDQYANSMPIIDLKNQIKGNSITNVAITRLK